MKQLNSVFRTNKKELEEIKKPIHKHLSLTIDFSENKEIIFIMYDYIEDIISTASLGMNGAALNPAKAGLFTVDKFLPLLN